MKEKVSERHLAYSTKETEIFSLKGEINHHKFSEKLQIEATSEDSMNLKNIIENCDEADGVLERIFIGEVLEEVCTLEFLEVIEGETGWSRISYSPHYLKGMVKRHWFSLDQKSEVIYELFSSLK